MKIQNLKDVFEKYRIYKLRVNDYHQSGFFANLSMQDIETKISEWSSYVEVIEKILADLDEEYAVILKAIYIENKKRQDLPYSDSTFYWKHKKATSNFMKYLRV